LKPFSLSSVCIKCGSNEAGVRWCPPMRAPLDKEIISRTCSICSFSWDEAPLDWADPLKDIQEFIEKREEEGKSPFVEGESPLVQTEDLDLVCPHCGDDFMGHHSRVRLDLHIRKNHAEKLESPLEKCLCCKQFDATEDKWCFTCNEGKCGVDDPKYFTCRIGLKDNKGCEYCRDGKKYEVNVFTAEFTQIGDRHYLELNNKSVWPTETRWPIQISFCPFCSTKLIEEKE